MAGRFFYCVLLLIFTSAESARFCISPEVARSSFVHIGKNPTLPSSKRLLTLRGGAEAEEEAAAQQEDAQLEDESSKAFDLDGWKRLYSNAENTDSILPEFWAKFDKNNWSLWFCDFQYNSDYSKKLQASNLIGGWFQRLDAQNARKIAFGCVHIFGQEPNLELAGCFLIRGKDIPSEFTDTPDFDTWTFTMVDTEDAAQRQAVNDFFRWSGDFGRPAGQRPHLVGKTYK